MVKQDVAEAILREYLTETACLDEKAAERIIKGTRKGVKEELAAEAKREKAQEKKERLRHGTTCFGIINPEAKKTIIEF